MSEETPEAPAVVEGRFTVTGRMRDDDASLYDVTVDGFGPPGTWGVLTGSPVVVALLAGLEGQSVAASPTGPFYALNRRDPAAILTALVEHTEVLATSGDVPSIDGEVPYGATP
jgi:hypothetical protein